MKEAGSRRVLVAHNVERRGRGGAARMMESMHSRLEAFGWQTDYFTSDDVAWMQSPKLQRHTFTWHVRRYARKAFLCGEPYDIINIHEPSGAAIVLGKSALGNPAVVAMSHGLEERYWDLRRRLGADGPEPPTLKESVSFPLLTRWQLRMTLRGADHVLCSNEDDRSFLVDRFGIDPQNITIITHGAGPEFSSVASRRIYRRPCSRILFSGTWIPRKGIRQVAEAFSILAARHPELQLGILGAGLSAERVLADFPGPLRNRIAVFAPLSHAECAETLLDYDIFLLPSYFEGGPLALIEAMYTGIPAITTSSWLRHLVRDNENCVLISPGKPAEIVNAVDRFIGDAGLRERLGRQGSADAISKCTWRALAESVNEVYSKLLEPKAG